MKRILAIILSIVLLFSLCACGNNKKAEKYCSSCGEGISRDVSFCEHCGAAVNNENTESDDASSDNSSSTESKTEETSNPSSSTENTSKPANTNSKPSSSTTPSKPSSSTENTSKPTNTSKPSTPTHTHSYSKKVTAATCTEKGYTTYTCSCGDTYKDTYTNPTHNYSNYKCTNCGTIDKSHTYEYLIEWVKSNGNANGESVKYSYSNNQTVYTLEYTANNKRLKVTTVHSIQSERAGLVMFLDNYSYMVSFDGHDVLGNLEAKTFTNNSPITYTDYYGPLVDKADMIESARLFMNMTIEWLDWCLKTNNMGITIKDLGFKAY